VKATNRVSLVVIAIVMVAVTVANPGQTAEAKSSPRTDPSTTAQWSLQVSKVDSGQVQLEPAFQIAIYEGLLEEMSKTKRFKQVFREGDRNATGAADLLILRTTVEKYTSGSETQRAVTTVRGATKLTVRSQLCTRDGQMILERTVTGSVRFLGSNLRATHNLARNVAQTIKDSPFTGPSPAVP
jgi:biopolymer transport protein ExbD